MNKTKAFINTVVILAILFNVAACAFFSLDKQSGYKTKASNLENSFNKLSAFNPLDSGLMIIRSKFDNEQSQLLDVVSAPFMNEDEAGLTWFCDSRILQMEIYLNAGLDYITTRNADVTPDAQLPDNYQQIAAAAAIDKAQALASAHAMPATTTTNPDTNPDQKSSRSADPSGDEAIAIEAAPSNNNTQIIQDMNQGQQGATIVMPHAG